jgi:hypothetical protein
MCPATRRTAAKRKRNAAWFMPYLRQFDDFFFRLQGLRIGCLAPLTPCEHIDQAPFISVSVSKHCIETIQRFQLRMNRRNRCNRLVLRIIRRKTASHFCWKCYKCCKLKAREKITPSHRFEMGHRS